MRKKYSGFTSPLQSLKIDCRLWALNLHVLSGNKLQSFLCFSAHVYVGEIIKDHILQGSLFVTLCESPGKRRGVCGTELSPIQLYLGGEKFPIFCLPC